MNFKRITAVILSCMMMFTCLPLTVHNMDAKAAAVKRYTVLVLDTSDKSVFSVDNVEIYRADTAIEYVKKAATRFLDNISKSKDENYVAIVSYKDTASVVSGFSDKYDELKQSVNSLYSSSDVRDISAGLQSASDLLNSISGNSTQKNVVLFTTGMTNNGNYNYDGHYSIDTIGSSWYRKDTNINLYAYANYAYEIALDIKNSGVNLYSLGLFQTMQGMPSEGKNAAAFFRLAAAELATSQDCFYAVDDPEKLEFTFGEIADDILEDPDAYINIHKTFYNAKHISWSENGFNNLTKDNSQLWINMVASRVWDSIKDLGEVATLRFDDLQIFADYYDIYLADMMLAFSEKTIMDDISWKVADYYSDTFSAIEDFLKSSDEYYKLKDILNSNDLETAFSSNYELSDSIKKTFGDVWDDATKGSQNAFASIWQGFDCANEICGYVSNGMDAFNTLKACYQAYCVASATKALCNEFFDFCDDTVKVLTRTNEKFAGWFNNALNKYKNQRQSDFDYFTTAKACFEGGKIVYNTFVKTAAKKMVYNGVAKVLGVGVGKVVAVIAAWNIGTMLGDLIAGKDTESAYYMYYVGPVEGAMQIVMDQYGKRLNDKPSMTAARRFNIAFMTLKYTNIALYGKAYTFAAKHRFLWFKTKTMKENMETASYYQSLWKIYRCHNSKGVSDGEITTISIKCPVDIYLYNDLDQLILRIADEQVEVYEDENVSFNIANMQKTISFPADQGYSLTIHSRDYGEMDYSIITENDGQFRYVEFYDVELFPEQEFYGNLLPGKELDANEYSLITEDNIISANYDSEDSYECEKRGHDFGDWLTNEKNGKELYKIQSRICRKCGLKEEVVSDYLPTITVSSHPAFAGDEIELTVSVSDNPGINTFTLDFDYDESVLQLIKVEPVSELGGQFTYSKKAVWLNGSDTNYNGDILKLYFKVSPDAVSGDAKVTLTYNAGDISNYNEDDIFFEVQPGVVSIQEKQTIPVTTEAPTTEAPTTEAPTTEAPTTEAPTTEAPTTEAPTSEPAWTEIGPVGDVNQDGKINSMDARLTLRFASKQQAATETEKLLADANGDKLVQAKDARLILRYAAKLDKAGENGNIISSMIKMPDNGEPAPSDVGDPGTTAIEPSQSPAEIPQSDDHALYNAFLKTELVPKYGLCDTENLDEKPFGIYSAKYIDLDNDNTEELIVAYAEKAGNEISYKLSCYGCKNGEVKLLGTQEAALLPDVRSDVRDPKNLPLPYESVLYTAEQDGVPCLIFENITWAEGYFYFCKVFSLKNSEFIETANLYNPDIGSTGQGLVYSTKLPEGMIIDNSDLDLSGDIIVEEYYGHGEKILFYDTSDEEYYKQYEPERYCFYDTYYNSVEEAICDFFSRYGIDRTDFLTYPGGGQDYSINHSDTSDLIFLDRFYSEYEDVFGDRIKHFDLFDYSNLRDMLAA